VFRVVEAALHFAKLRVEDEARRAVPGREFHRAPDFAEEQVGDALNCLYDNVAGKAVHDDDIGMTATEILALDVADEVEAAVAKGLVHLDNELVALRGLFADGEERDPRLADIEHALHIRGSHMRELDEMDWAAVRIRTDVEEHRDAVGPGREDGRKCGAPDTADAAQREQRRSHGCTGVT